MRSVAKSVKAGSCSHINQWKVEGVRSHSKITPYSVTFSSKLPQKLGEPLLLV